jgi:hypothetical protein
MSGRIDWSIAPPPLPPQTLGVPPPPHVSLPVQVPHDSVPPQPSPMLPQFLPWALHVVGTHAGTPQTLGVPPPPHDSGLVQLPHDSVPPQPSPMVPQFFP